MTSVLAVPQVAADYAAEMTEPAAPSLAAHPIVEDDEHVQDARQCIEEIAQHEARIVALRERRNRSIHLAVSKSRLRAASVARALPGVSESLVRSADGYYKALERARTSGS